MTSSSSSPSDSPLSRINNSDAWICRQLITMTGIPLLQTSPMDQSEDQSKSDSKSNLKLSNQDKDSSDESSKLLVEVLVQLYTEDNHPEWQLLWKALEMCVENKIELNRVGYTKSHSDGSTPGWRLGYCREVKSGTIQDLKNMEFYSRPKYVPKSASEAVVQLADTLGVDDDFFKLGPDVDQFCYDQQIWQSMCLGEPMPISEKFKSNPLKTPPAWLHALNDPEIEDDSIYDT